MTAKTAPIQDLADATEPPNGRQPRGRASSVSEAMPGSFDLGAGRAPLRRGHGLKSMESRANAIGGSLSVTSIAGGTEVSLRLPPDSTTQTTD